MGGIRSVTSTDKNCGLLTTTTETQWAVVNDVVQDNPKGSFIVRVCAPIHVKPLMSLYFTWMLWPAVCVFNLCSSSGLPAPGVQAINFNLWKLSHPLTTTDTHTNTSNNTLSSREMSVEEKDLTCYSDMVHFSRSLSGCYVVLKEIHSVHFWSLLAQMVRKF